ncbi:MAG: alpha/beta fold hydrolase [Solirubrobacteraceae bacterium]
MTPAKPVAGVDYPSSYAALRAWFPDAEMVTIAGSGHFVGVEQPERFREEIIRFAAP